MDYTQRREQIGNSFFAAALAGFHAILDASREREPVKLREVLSRASCDHPDGRFLVAQALAQTFCAQTGIEHLRDSAAEPDMDAIAEFPADQASIMEPETYQARENAARYFILLWLHTDENTMMTVCDEHADSLLIGLAEMVAASFPLDKPQIFDGLPPEVLDAARLRTQPLIAACRRRDSEAADKLLTSMVQKHGIPGRYALAEALVIIFTTYSGLDQTLRKLRKDQIMKVDMQLPDVIMYGDGYLQRTEQANTYIGLSLNFTDDITYAMAEKDTSHDLLHGLCELVASLIEL